MQDFNANPAGSRPGAAPSVVRDAFSHGKEAKLSLGHYPVVPLAVARKKARAEAEKRAGGIDPREARREEEERDRVARLNTFELTARAWHVQAQKDRQWSASYAEKVMRHLELHVFPWIGGLMMSSIAPTELVRCLHRIKERGHLETAQRVREAVQHLFQYADGITSGCTILDDRESLHRQMRFCLLAISDKYIKLL